MAQRYRTKRGTSVGEMLIAWAYEATASLVLFSVCMFAFLGLGLRQIVVDGGSMMDTLRDGDRLVIQAHGAPHRGDIVVIDRYVDKPLIKRVVAVAGDVVEIDPERNRLVLNGVEQDDPYPHYPTVPYDMREAVSVPEGYIFVLGDHRDNSHDSRYEDIGLVRVEDVVGHAVWRLWPRPGLL